MSKNKVIKQKDGLTIYNAGIFCSENNVTEVGRYKKAAPCMGVGLWSGSGYMLNTFVVWDCDYADAALAAVVHKCIRNKWTGLYITEDQHAEYRAEGVKDALKELDGDALSETAEAVVIEYARAADGWIGGLINNLVDAVQNCRAGCFGRLWEVEGELIHEDSVIHYAEQHFTDFDNREAVLDYLHAAYSTVADALDADENFDYNYGWCYVDMSGYGEGVAYVRSENLGFDEFDSGEAYVAAVLATAA